MILYIPSTDIITANTHHATAEHDTAVATYVRLSFMRILLAIEEVINASVSDTSESAVPASTDGSLNSPVRKRSDTKTPTPASTNVRMDIFTICSLCAEFSIRSSSVIDMLSVNSTTLSCKTLPQTGQRSLSTTSVPQTSQITGIAPLVY